MRMNLFLFIATILVSNLVQAGGYSYCDFELGGKSCGATETDTSRPESSSHLLSVYCGSYYFQNMELSSYSVSENSGVVTWNFAIRGEKVSCTVID